jgi:hypothetical protein
VFAKLQDAAVSGGVYTLTVTNAHATLQRVDRVVVRFDLTNGTATLRMVDGTAAATGTAVPPALTQSSTVWDVPLALVIVDAAVSTIAAVDVIDNRLFSYTQRSLAEALAIENPIVNGGMAIWNDGTSLAAIADGTYAAEMWRYGKVGAVVHTVSQSTDVPAVSESVELESYSTKLDVTTVDSSIAAGDYCIYEQRIEGQRFRPLAQRSFTLPFWIKSPKVGVHCVAFVNSGGDRSCVTQVFVEVANTWQLCWVHVPASPVAGTWDYTNGIGLRVVFALSCGSTFQTGAPGTWQTGLFYGTSRQVNTTDNAANDLYLAAVGRMSRGGLALPFSPHKDEELLSKRYYEVLGGDATNQILGMGAGQSSTITNCAVQVIPKRVAPSVSYSAAADFQFFGASGVPGTAISTSNIGKSTVQVVLTTLASGAAVAAFVLQTTSTNARMKVNARL